MKNLPFQTFRKTALLQARPLTQDDYQQRGGIIQTREGSAGFKPGDYLARGIQNEEWPITKEHFATSYEQFSEPDAAGFAAYRAIDICLAYQMPEPFTVRRMRGDTLTGKAGDYLVRSGERMWIVDHIIFEQSYEQVP
jgi:hypothetical protein